MILEEAAFMSAELFRVVCVPLLGVKFTAMLAISTPAGDDDSYYSMLLDLLDPDTGKRIFKVEQIGLACDSCIAADKAAACPHRLDLNPSWKSKKGYALQKAILGSSETFERETQGRVLTARRPAFDAKDVDALFNQPRVSVVPADPSSPGVIYLGVDPNGLGKSDTGMIAAVFDHLRRFIVSLSSLLFRGVIGQGPDPQTPRPRAGLARRSLPFCGAD